MDRTRHTPTRGARPGNTRPGLRGGITSRPSKQGKTLARPRFTSRAAVLVLVLAVLVVSYASSLKAYLRQHDQIAALQSQIQTSQANIGRLSLQKARWKDKAYVEALARQRFGWVLPGQISYQVLGRNGKPLNPADVLANPNSVAQALPTPWWSKAYGTLSAVDHPKKKITEKPATHIGPADENGK